MIISDISIHAVPTSPTNVHKITQVPTVKLTQYTHRRSDQTQDAHTYILCVQTDEGITSHMDIHPQSLTGHPKNLAALLRGNVVGENPLAREYLFQKLFLGTRWVYQHPGWFGAFDLCLWDIAGKQANMPVADLMGRVRDGIPIYQTSGDGPVELYIEHVEKGRELGINAYKPHSYKGGKADLPMLEALRKAVGPDYDLMLDPVCQYSLREAIEVGRLMSDLDYLWLEEPMFEQKMTSYQRLCGDVDIPIMATERLMHDMDLTAQWLIHGATDMLRGNARDGGATQILKLAHFAELNNTTIELNGPGALYGIVHAVLGQVIQNTQFYELSCGGDYPRPDDRFKEQAEVVGMMNAPRVVDGKMIPEDGPGWGAKWDIEYLNRKTEEVF